MLREVEEDDLVVFFDHQRDPEANQLAAFPPRDYDAFMEHWHRILADPTTVIRAIVFGGELAGNIGSWNQEGKQKVGYWIGREYWGRGVATEALAQLLSIVQLRPLYAHVARHNAASRRVLEKCGFTVCEEGPAPNAIEDGVDEQLFRLEPTS